MTKGRIAVYHYMGEVGSMMVDVLNGHGYETVYRPIAVQTQLGSIAREVSEQKPNLVFLAQNFGKASSPHSPHIEGLDELVRIKEETSVPVVIVTGDGETFKDDALSKGAAAYLTTPFPIAELCELTDRLTGNQPQS